LLTDPPSNETIDVFYIKIMVYVKEVYVRMTVDFFFPGAIPLIGPGPPHY